MSAIAPPYAPDSRVWVKRPEPYPVLPTGAPRLVGDRYLIFLGIVLLGYAILGRGFAYLGVAPLFIGEVALFSGALVAWRAGALSLPLAAWPGRLLATFMVWGLIRTLPFIPEYGVDALRDAVLWGYGLFAFIVAGLLLRHGDRFRTLLTSYRTLVVVFLALGWVAFIAARVFSDQIPRWPGSDVKMVEGKGGDLLVHLAGVAAFVMVGMRRMTMPVLLGFVVALAVILTSNRGGMVAFGAAMLVVLFLRPPRAQFARLALALVILASLVVLINPTFQIGSSGRTVSVEQVGENIRSLVGASDQRYLTSTVEWRVEWWREIAGYTFGGPHLVGGKGYGINLNVDDGHFGPVDLRSPHNGHMTVLARSGVVGLLLWLAVLGSWFWMALAGWYRARLAGDNSWTAVWAFLIAYAVAFLVNASFDVYLEGPMGGIWFWCVFGTGIAAGIVQQRGPGLLHDSPNQANSGDNAEIRPPYATV